MSFTGLQLILNVNQDEYMSEGDDAAGMRLVIHRYYNTTTKLLLLIILLL